jgi:outer membrane protein
MKRIVPLVLCAALALLPCVAAAQSVKIGFINGVRLERESKLSQQITAGLKKEFSAREQELNSLQGRLQAMKSELDKLTPGTAEMDKKQREFTALSQRFEQTRRIFFEDLDRRKAEEQQKFLREVNLVVKKIAEAQKFDLIMQEAVFAGRSIDVTDQVMKALDASQGAGN